jgi:hypothetical protein
VTRDFGAPQPTLEGMKTGGSADLAREASFRVGSVAFESPYRWTFLMGKLLIPMEMTAAVF